MGDFFLFPNNNDEQITLVNMPLKMQKLGYQQKAWEYSSTLFVFTCLIPMLHLIGLAFMWTIPLSYERQVMAYHLLEIASAWYGLISLSSPPFPFIDDSVSIFF